MGASASLSSPEADDSQPQHIYYDGELCEAETLPNGFTKIRSKNLDILFKREYYEQRIATQKQLSEELKTDNNKSLEKEVLSVKVTNDEDTISEKVDMVGTADNDNETISLDRIDTDEIREFKPMNHGMEMLETPIPDMESGQTSPFHTISYQSYQSCEELPQESYGITGSGRPNLYLYSPSNNSLIPCEEIIIPNPVVSTETGETAGYTGPTNIYLAYPVQGPDGRSYITQPFPIVESSYIPSQGYPGYSHSVSYDGSSF